MGGFVLVHAGMMTVVFTLANMTGGVFYVLIVAVGNVSPVMALEALFVNIQVLRLSSMRSSAAFSTRTAFPSLAQNLSGPSRGQGRMNLCARKTPHRCRTQLLFCYPARTAPGL